MASSWGLQCWRSNFLSILGRCWKKTPCANFLSTNKTKKSQNARIPIRTLTAMVLSISVQTTKPWLQDSRFEWTDFSGSHFHNPMGKPSERARYSGLRLIRICFLLLNCTIYCFFGLHGQKKNWTFLRNKPIRMTLVPLYFLKLYFTVFFCCEMNRCSSLFLTVQGQRLGARAFYCALRCG